MEQHMKTISQRPIRCGKTTEAEEKQIGYAKYLLKLPISRRNEMLANMRKPLREKMRGLIRDAWAKQIANFNPDVKRMYLEKLRNENRCEFNVLIGLINKEENQKEEKPC